MGTSRIVDSFVGWPASGAGLRDYEQTAHAQGVEGAVLIQSRPSSEETERALSFAADADWVAAVVGWVDLQAPDVDKRLAELAALPKFRGVCHPVAQEYENRWLLRPDVLRGLRAVAERGLSLDLLVEPRNLPSVAELAAELPGLRMVIDHIGSPFIANGIREPWGVYMTNIAPCRNVWCKVSGLVTRDVRPGWNVAHFRGFVEVVVRLFGYDRLMFGSDWPEHVAVASFDDVLRATLEAAGPFTPAQEARFLAGTAAEFYRIDQSQTGA